MVVKFFRVPYIQELQQRVRSANARAKKQNIEGRITVQDVLRQYYRQRGTCIHCGSSLYPNSNRKFEIDHLTSLSRRGDNLPGNIAISCIPCNRRKGDMSLERWIGVCAARGILHPYAYLVHNLVVQLTLFESTAIINDLSEAA